MITLPPPNVSPEARAAFARAQPQIIAVTVARLLAVPGEFDHLGSRTEDILISGLEFTFASLEACMQINHAALLVDQLRWSQDRLPQEGINMQQMARNLQVYAEVTAEVLPAGLAVEIVAMIGGLLDALAGLQKAVGERKS